MSPRRRHSMSDRQATMLKFIGNFASDRGFPPTVREIGVEMEISSTSVVDYHLRALEKFGHIRRVKKLSRGIELTAETTERKSRPRRPDSRPYCRRRPYRSDQQPTR